MPNPQATIMAISVHETGDNPVFGQSKTLVRIEDEAAGPFIVLEQCGESEFQNGKLCFDIEHLREVLRQAEFLLQQKTLGGGE